MTLIKINNRGTSNTERGRNLLYNGEMSVWQRLSSGGRNAPTADTVSSSTYGNSTTTYPTNVPGADRWKLRHNGSATWQISRSVDVPSGQGFPFSYKLVNNATEDIRASTTDRYVLFEQRIPQEDVQHLLYGTADAKSVTVSFWVKSNQTGKVHIGMYLGSDTVPGTPTIDNIHITRYYTINAADTWEYKTVTFVGLTNTDWVLNKFNQKDSVSNDNGLLLWHWLDHSAAGSAYYDPSSDVKQDNVWSGPATSTGYILESGNIEMAGTAGANFLITGCQMEVGTVATDFEFIPFYDQLSRCQRFYYNHQYTTRLTGTTNRNRMYSATWNNSTATFGQYELPAPMHRNPDYTITASGTGANYQLSFTNNIRVQTYESSDAGHYIYQVHADAEL